MNYQQFEKTLPEYEKDLKEAKKKFDKLSKQYKKCRSAYQAEVMYDDLTILNEDIAELQMIVKELRQQKKLAEIESYWLFWQCFPYVLQRFGVELEDNAENWYLQLLSEMFWSYGTCLYSRDERI